MDLEKEFKKHPCCIGAVLGWNEALIEAIEKEELTSTEIKMKLKLMNNAICEMI